MSEFRNDEPNICWECDRIHEDSVTECDPDRLFEPEPESCYICGVVVDDDNRYPGESQLCWDCGIDEITYERERLD